MFPDLGRSEAFLLCTPWSIPSNHKTEPDQLVHFHCAVFPGVQQRFHSCPRTFLKQTFVCLKTSASWIRVEANAESHDANICHSDVWGEMPPPLQTKTDALPETFKDLKTRSCLLVSLVPNLVGTKPTNTSLFLLRSYRNSLVASTYLMHNKRSNHHSQKKLCCNPPLCRLSACSALCFLRFYLASLSTVFSPSSCPAPILLQTSFLCAPISLNPSSRTASISMNQSSRAVSSLPNLSGSLCVNSSAFVNKL